AGAGRGESRSAFRACARGRRQAEGKVLGTACGHELGAALARPGKETTGPRSTCPGLRMVHGRFQHARSEDGEGVAGGVEWDQLKMSRNHHSVFLKLPI